MTQVSTSRGAPAEPPDPEREREVERRVSVRLAQASEARAFLWRLRLIIVETLILGALVAAAGFVLHQPPLDVLRSALFVSGACFASGMMLIGLSALTVLLVARIRFWWVR